MVVRLLLSSLPDLSLFPRNNVSVFSQKILSYVDLCSQRLGPPASFFLLFIWQPYLLNYACDGLFNTESMAANMES